MQICEIIIVYVFFPHTKIEKSNLNHKAGKCIFVLFHVSPLSSNCMDTFKQPCHMISGTHMLHRKTTSRSLMTYYMWSGGCGCKLDVLHLETWRYTLSLVLHKCIGNPIHCQQVRKHCSSFPRCIPYGINRISHIMIPTLISKYTTITWFIAVSSFQCLIICLIHCLRQQRLSTFFLREPISAAMMDSNVHLGALMFWFPYKSIKTG